MVRWIITRRISLRDAAEEVGFKIDRLDNFSVMTQNEFKKGIVNTIVGNLDYEWAERQSSRPYFSKFSTKLADVTTGIYVLCLDGGLCVNYPTGNSRVLYIGKGHIRQRIKNHLERKLLNFFLQIPGIEFRFYMTQVDGDGHFHDFEHDLLIDFSRLYGGTDGQKQWPMFNKNAGTSHYNQHDYATGWNRPLKNTKANYVWSLSPTTVKAQPKLDD